MAASTTNLRAFVHSLLESVYNKQASGAATNTNLQKNPAIKKGSDKYQRRDFANTYNPVRENASPIKSTRAINSQSCSVGLVRNSKPKAEPTAREPVQCHTRSPINVAHHIPEATMNNLGAVKLTPKSFTRAAKM
jgi:hypothetical protein